MSFKPPKTPTAAVAVAAAANAPPQFPAVPSPSPASGVMDHAGEFTTPSASPLDKPLAELTEEDIAQLTREDCRRYLKAKGMRRPSWNKSQAIQQVVSLKALLEGRPGSDDSPVAPGVLRKTPVLPPPPPPPPQSSSPASLNPPQATDASPGTEPAGNTKPPSPSLPKDPSPYRRRDPMPPPSAPVDSTCRAPVAGKDGFPPENRCLSPRPTAEAPAGQMTIFYDGKINVYNEVTGEQARLIMELAASTVCFEPQAGPLFPSSLPPIPRSPPAFLRPGSPPALTACPLSGNFRASASGGRWGHHYVASGGEMDRRVSRETEHEGPASRKASLQRYLEKRKDRFKGKRILVGSGSTNMEAIYSGQTIIFQNLSEHSKQAVMSCSSLPPPPGTPSKYSSMDHRTQKERMSIDLNDDGWSADQDNNLICFGF